MTKRICLIDGFHPATAIHSETPSWPFLHSDGYPPVVVHAGIIYADTGQYIEQDWNSRLYLKAPSVVASD